MVQIKRHEKSLKMRFYLKVGYKITKNGTERHEKSLKITKNH